MKFKCFFLLRRYVGKIVRFLSNPVPYFVFYWKCWVVDGFWWSLQIYLYRLFLLPRVERRVAHLDKINIVFFSMSLAYWKYDSLYEKLTENHRYNVLIFPVVLQMQPYDIQMKEYHEMVSTFIQKGYKVIRSYDEKNKSWLPVVHLKPDIIFYTQPYSDARRILPMYNFWAMRKSLLCYSPYFYFVSSGKWVYDNVLQNFCWRTYYPCEYHRVQSCEVMRNHGVNTRVAGYFFEEDYGRVSKTDADAVWRKDPRKRIIWAPHHSVFTDDSFAFSSSTFLQYYDFMKELAVRYKDKVMFTFKPHPVLFTRLLDRGIWTRKQIDEYIDFWSNGENTQYKDGDYLNLFKGSDALIHDCDSFITEYHYTRKPAMFLFRSNRLNSEVGIGKLARDLNYQGHCESDIVSFIEDVVIGGADSRLPMRNEFYKTYLGSPTGKTYSENVADDIENSLKMAKGV